MTDQIRTAPAGEAETEKVEIAPSPGVPPTPKDDSDVLSINEAALGDNLPPGYFMSLPFIGLMTGLCLGVISSYVIFVMATNVLTFTNADIGPSANISWVSIARTLGQSTMYLIQGRLSDLFGRRWFFIGGNLVALLGVIICAVAQDVNTLIVASAIYGMGECVQVSFGVAIGELIPNKDRPMVMSFVFLTSAPFSAFGPTIARRMISVGLGWRWCYYLGIICIAAAAILLFFFYHPPTFHMLHERKSKKQQLRELDYVGMFLWTTGLTLFLMGLSWGGGLFPWKSAAVIATLLIGIATLVAFGLWEAYADLKYPVMPLHFFRNRGYIGLVAQATVASMFYYSAILLWPQQVQAMYTTDITYAGWLSCTVSAATSLGQGVAGGLMRFGGNSRHWMIFASISMVAFVVALAALTPETKAMGIAFTILGPFWVGFIELAAMSLAPLFLPPEDLGLANGMLASIRSAGGSIAVAVYTTILTNRLTTTLKANVGGAAVEAGYPTDKVPALVAAVKGSTWTKLPGLSDSVKIAVQGAIPTAYGQAFKTVYLASLAFGGIAIIGSLLTKDARKHLDNTVARRMHGKGLGGQMDKPAPKTIENVED